jgi:hypothetical protein
LDEVLVLHGVGDAADLDPDAVRGLLDHGDVLLARRVDGVFGLKDHGLAAANELAAPDVQHLDDVAAEGALVDLKSLADVRHVDISLKDV